MQIRRKVFIKKPTHSWLLLWILPFVITHRVTKAKPAQSSTIPDIILLCFPGSLQKSSITYLSSALELSDTSLSYVFWQDFQGLMSKKLSQRPLRNPIKDNFTRKNSRFPHLLKQLNYTMYALTHLTFSRWSVPVWLLLETQALGWMLVAGLWQWDYAGIIVSAAFYWNCKCIFILCWNSSTTLACG